MDNWEPWLVLDSNARDRVRAHVIAAVERWVQTWWAEGQIDAHDVVVSMERAGPAHSDVVTPGFIYRDNGTAPDSLGLWVPEELPTLVLGCHRDYAASPLSDTVAQDSVAMRVTARLVSALAEELLGNAARVGQMTPCALSLEEQRGDPAMRQCWVVSVTMREGCPLLTLLCAPALMQRWGGLDGARDRIPSALARRAEAIGDGVVSLQARFNSLELPVAELAGLEVGDVVLLEPGDDECLELHTAAGECIATVSLGRQSEQRALAILKLRDPPQSAAMRRVRA